MYTRGTGGPGDYFGYVLLFKGYSGCCNAVVNDRTGRRNFIWKSRKVLPVIALLFSMSFVHFSVVSGAKSRVLAATSREV